MKAHRNCKLASFVTMVFIEVLFSLCLRIYPATAGWQTETVDSGGIVGLYSSLALDASGNPAISYYDATNGNLKYARFNGVSWDITTVDSGTAIKDTSLAFDGFGNPAISYHSNSDLKFAHFNGTDWVIEIVDFTGNVGGSHSSLVFDGFDNPAISYHYFHIDTTHPSFFPIHDLKYAHFNGTSWDITTIEFAGINFINSVGMYNSLAIDLSGNPAISYYGFDFLRYAHFNGVSWDITTVDSAGSVGEFTSLAIGPSGNPAISYYDLTNKDLKFAHFNGVSWDITTVDSVGDVGEFTSLALDPLGNPAISYYDLTNKDLMYARFNGTDWIIKPIDSTGDVGKHTSLVFNSSGNPAISYYDATNGGIKLARFMPDDVCQCLVDSPLGCVSGRVTSHAGEPLAGKTVKFKGRLFPGGPRLRMETLTDNDGCYQFNFPEGVGKIRVRRCRGGGGKSVGVPFGGKVNAVDFECKERRRRR